MSQAGAGLLYLLSCLAKFGDMRAEMEAAGAVDILLELLSTCHDTKVQVKLLSSNHALLETRKPYHPSAMARLLCRYRRPAVSAVRAQAV